MTPSVGGPWLCDRCQKLIAPATNKSAAVASSSHVLVVSTEPFILLYHCVKLITHTDLHTGSTKLRQQMFQQAADESVHLLNKLLDFVAVSRSDGSSRVLALSIFSYSSEILEKRLQIATREA